MHKTLLHFLYHCASFVSYSRYKITKLVMVILATVDIYLIFFIYICTRSRSNIFYCFVDLSKVHIAFTITSSLSILASAGFQHVV